MQSEMLLHVIFRKQGLFGLESQRYIYHIRGLEQWLKL